MAVFNEPNQWEHPLGNNADASTLPDDAVATAGIASLQKLFQTINAIPLEAGGIAPDREDVNALFKYLGDQIFYTQNGGIPSYNADYDYVAGRVVLYNGNLYKCIQANGALNVHNPEEMDYWLRVALNNDLSDYLPLVGGNVTGNLTVQDKNVVRSVNGVEADAEGNVDVIADYKNTDSGYIQFINGLIFAWSAAKLTGINVINKPKPFTTVVAYISDVASARTSQMGYQAWVSNESTNTTDTFRSINSGGDGVAIFWIGKV